MLGILIDIFISIRIRKQTLNRNPDGSVKRDGNLQRQMFFLMLASICVFLITTLPLAIYRIISPRQGINVEIIQGTVNNLTILTWLQSLNYAVSYIYILIMICSDIYFFFDIDQLLFALSHFEIIS